VIVVDEEGTEAAAATFAITVLRMSYQIPNPEPFILDRPFIFLLRDKNTSINLFLGAVKKLPNEAPAMASSQSTNLPSMAVETTTASLTPDPEPTVTGARAVEVAEVKTTSPQ